MVSPCGTLCLEGWPAHFSANTVQRSRSSKSFALHIQPPQRFLDPCSIVESGRSPPPWFPTTATEVEKSPDNWKTGGVFMDEFHVRTPQRRPDPTADGHDRVSGEGGRSGGGGLGWCKLPESPSRAQDVCGGGSSMLGCLRCWAVLGSLMNSVKQS